VTRQSESESNQHVSRPSGAVISSTCYRFDDVSALLEIALDLCANMTTEERYRRLAAAARREIPCDAITVLRIDGDALVPVIANGLHPDALTRRFSPAEHPRLQQILDAGRPIRFPNSEMADPFDGLLSIDRDALSHPHACMGCPLIIGAEVIGAITFDALAPTAFDRIDDHSVALVAALAAVALHTSALFDALEQTAARNRLVVRQVLHDAMQRGGGEILGTSAAIARLREEIAVVASSDLSALITGETGVGKELVAHAIHAGSARSEGALIHVNCAALPESIAESELFGHVKGAFTGAADHRAGKFEVADGGTLFLDEIGELPLSIQPKLLRALQSGEIQRVGADRMLRVDVRVIAATNRDLAAEVNAGRFRGDLYHRLRVYPIHVPPLRERRDDIAQLAGYFLDVARVRLGLGQLRLTAAARACLREAPWPGNVRELEHTLQRAALRAGAGRGRETIIIDESHLGFAHDPVNGKRTLPTTSSLRDAVDDFTRDLISNVVAECSDNWAEAARRLGLQRGNLHRLARRLGLHHA